MTPLQHFAEVCSAWRRLSQSEADSIRALDWHAVTECQAAKTLLEPVLATLCERLTRETGRGNAPDQAAAALVRDALADLIRLEQENDQLLQGGREGLAARRSELSLAHQTLGRVQRSYGQSCASHWQAYS